MKVGCREAPDFFVIILFLFFVFEADCLPFPEMVVLDIALEMFVIVLSLVLGAVAVFYGTGGAVVVAGKAR